MKFGTGKQIAIVLGFVAAGFATACSSDDTTDNSTTGSATTGTTGETTGSTSSTTGSGSTSTSSGSGSTGGSAGTTGDAGGLVGMPLFTFDSAIQGFAVNTDPSSTILPDGGAGMVNFDNTVGHPNPGSLKLTIPFSDYSQKFDIQTGLTAADWSCKRLHVWVMFDTVTGINGLQPHVLSKQTIDGGDVYSYASQFSSVSATSAGTWVEYTFDISHPGYMGSGYDPTHIQDVGIQIITSDPPAADSDAGPPAKAGNTIVHVDSFSLEDIADCSADGGTGGSTSTTGSGTSGGSDGGASEAGTTGGSDGGATGGSDGGATGGSDGGASEAGATTGNGTTGTNAGDAGTAG